MLIPKRFASRLRAAYDRLNSKRDYVAYAEAKILDCEIELKEFKEYPDRYVHLRYPRCGGVDSYPVQTHLSRIREEFLHKQERLHDYIVEMEEADRTVTTVETDVLQAVSTLRNSTKGRVEWPDKPTSLEMHRKIQLASFHDSRIKYAKHLSKQESSRQAFDNQYAQKEAALDAQSEVNFEASLALMPPEKATALRFIHMKLKSAIDQGEFSLNDMLALANGDQSKFKEIVGLEEFFRQSR